MANELVWALADKPENAPTQELTPSDEPYVVRIGAQYIKIKVSFGLQLPEAGDAAMVQFALRDNDNG